MSIPHKYLLSFAIDPLFLSNADVKSSFKKVLSMCGFSNFSPCLFHETGNKSEKMRKFQKAVMTPAMKVEERAKTVTNVDWINQFNLSLKAWHCERAYEG